MADGSKVMRKVAVGLVGHCGPDASYLRLAVARAIQGATVIPVDDDRELNKAITEGVDLLLLNRQLDWGFQTTEGVELIRQLRAKHQQLKLMLISNYEESQAAAVAAGALPGFGKRELGSPRVGELLRAAVEQPLKKGL
ncbi:MAG TPA: hypothetical protein VH518_22570 [Tepidisphaeraceae bacterium]|jgi:CheY-like chemotaxis protein